MKNDEKKPNFEGIGILPAMLERLKELGFKNPTPIQHKAIPIATSGEDVVGIAQTGSGKTLAFSIPMIQSVSLNKKTGLILLPTRELALQVKETLDEIAGNYGLKTALIIGGVNSGPQVRQLKKNPHVIIATPGRLIDHVEQKNVSLSNVGMLVLDEADRMLDMGFAHQLNKILAWVPKDRQTMLFSATMPDKIAELANQYMKKPLRIEVARQGTTAKTIDQEVYIVHKNDKLKLLKKILEENEGSVLVFTRTKHGAKKLAIKIRNMGHTADELHGNRSQNQRQKALKGFDSGFYRVMVATDIAARGIDVDHLAIVINFDLPTQTEDYTHRIGRTGRAGRSGLAISFASPEEHYDIAEIQKLINMTLPIKSPCGKDLDSIANTGHKKPKGPSKQGRNKRNSSRGRRK
jgi:ATP-dependent RNA helicase RhlE